MNNFMTTFLKMLEWTVYLKNCDAISLNKAANVAISIFLGQDHQSEERVFFSHPLPSR